jgi:acyl carrier protein
MNEITNEITQHMADTFGFEPEDIQPDFDLRQDLNATELELADFVTALEHQYGVEISATEIRNTITVSDLFELMLDKLNEIG